MHPNNQCLEKLKAKQEMLMDAFISVKEKYEIIKPALFNQGVCSNWGKGKASRGYDVIRYTIANDVIKDIHNIAFDDSDKNSVSIVSIYKKLSNEGVLRQAKSWCVIDDKFLADAYSKQFDEAWTLFSGAWNRYKDNPCNKAIKKIRDKIVAHSELKYDETTNTYTLSPPG